jgi:hypothetical protein
MTMKRLPIGISDFKELIENDYYFVDTTQLIGDIFREAAKIALITRPRRFGKTLNMSMLHYFYDNRLNTSKLFSGLNISKDKEMMQQLNAYPTIFITFKDIKDLHWETAEMKIKNMLSSLFDDFADVIVPVLKSDVEKRVYQNIINREANIADYQEALKNLTEYLYRAYNKPVLILIDEYDVPIQSGWSNDYYDKIIDFMRGFLSGALKDNSYLFKAVLTGIYRVAKESIFSGLNNLIVYTIFKRKYAEYFGFTEEETEKLCQSVCKQQDEILKENLKSWYNGYYFSGLTIYNPWSVINYLYEKELKPYWINTSSNDLIIQLIEENIQIDETFRQDIETLIAGESVQQTIDDSSALRDLQTRPDSIWTLFLFSGYLKAQTQELKKGKYHCELKIPNEEVLIFFQDTVFYWIEKAGRRILTSIVEPLVKGDGQNFCEKLKSYVSNTLSYFDIKGEPENTYHMILLGMFAHLTEDYWIKSNRESGLGRYDILLKAKDKKNYSTVIEIKSNPSKIKEAMDQIDNKEYIEELISEGYTKIMKVALGVDGKRIDAMVKSTGDGFEVDP